MDAFPEFMKNPANRIARSNQATPGVEGYVFDGADQSQMAFWTRTQTATSGEHVHEFDGRTLVVRVFLHPPDAEVSTLLLFLLKETGGMALMLAAMLYLASRDPERNAAIVNGLIVGLVVLAVTPLLSLYTTDVGRIYPAHLVWGRSIVRLVFAAFFLLLRPRDAQWKPAGRF